MIRVNEKQKNAKKWKNDLNKIGSAKVGELQIAYLNNEKKKSVGYVALTDIDLIVDGDEMTVGELLNSFIEMRDFVRQVKNKFGGVNKK